MNATTYRILVVDDEPVVAEVVHRYLAREGHEVRTAGDGETALKIFDEWSPALVVLDLMIPGIDGIEVCKRLRKVSAVPVIMLTARGDEPDRIAGLETGADDYVVKPFSPRELVARVKAVFRRLETGPAALSAAQTARYGDLVVDPVARSVSVRGSAIEMTAKEFDLLFFLAARPGQVFTREQLMKLVWDYAIPGDSGTVTVHMRRLREKIEADPAEPRWLKTVWGVGYKFEGEG